jgi:hypothetical protein
MTKSDLLTLLQERFAGLDVTIAKKEVAPFLKDPAALNLWSSEFLNLYY